MTINIQIDGSPEAYGAECDERTAQRANEKLVELLTTTLQRNYPDAAINIQVVNHDGNIQVFKPDHDDAENIEGEILDDLVLLAQDAAVSAINEIDTADQVGEPRCADCGRKLTTTFDHDGLCAECGEQRAAAEYAEMDE